MTRWITIFLAVCGVAVAVFATRAVFPDVPPLPPSREPSANPFGKGVAALGVIECATKQSEIAAPVPGLVMKVLANVGDRVDAGQPLFELDARTVDADLVRAKAAVEVAQSNIDRWHAIPRAEDLPPLQAAVAQASAELADQKDRLARVEDAIRKGSATERDQTTARFDVARAQAALALAQTTLDRAVSGGWKADLTVAAAELAARQAEVNALTILRDRLTVRAPRAGTVLRRDIEPGEFASADAARPAMIVGDLSALNIRAQVDEEDISLVRATSKAVLRTRGAVVEQIDLKVLRIEPFAGPKTQLSGRNTERVDTRVVEVVLAVQVAPKKALLVPGQSVDVYVDAASE